MLMKNRRNTCPHFLFKFLYSTVPTVPASSPVENKYIVKNKISQMIIQNSNKKVKISKNLFNFVYNVSEILKREYEV